MKLVIIIELEQYVEGPKLTDENVLSKVKLCDLNPIDTVVTSVAVSVEPIAHIPVAR
ncbi:MAG: hypothetical protein ACJ71I_01640 [Nitrososphaeraceae archaeon]